MILVEDLNKSFDNGSIKAVHNVSFSIPKGKVGALIGTSGCGKTTTLKLINRLITPESGKIWVQDESADSFDPISWRRKIGHVVQKGGLFPHMTVFENISLLSKILKRPLKQQKERVAELLEMVHLNLSTHGDRYPQELSGGQQQRVGIARALMEDPPVLLMDEPFGALDPITRQSMHEEFLELNQKIGKTILMVTHDLSEAFKLADEVMLMKKGEIVQSGHEEDFRLRPQNEFVKSFLQEHSW